MSTNTSTPDSAHAALNAALQTLPAPLRQETENRVRDLTTPAEQGNSHHTLPQPLLDTVPLALATSDFITEQLRRDPTLLASLAPRVLSPDGDRYDVAALRREIADAPDEASLGRLLRRARRELWVVIAWRDLCGMANLAEVMSLLSSFADTVLSATIEKLWSWRTATLGTPVDSETGQPAHPIVLGLGKLGGEELNFSSDIDLIFAYEGSGTTDGGPRSLDNQEFFLRLFRDLVKLLSESTPDGQVFRVDTRLRPFGNSGALALESDAMEQYYTRHGRDWERYALIKARVCGGNPAAGNRLLEALRPFVYRRYIDFSAIDALRDMKAQIEAQVARQGGDNLKTGGGGIREIEFIAQTYQLIRAGREAALRTPSLQRVYRYLAAEGHLPADEVSALLAAYEVLRNCEHRIQMLRDQQTHDLPTDPTDRARVALGMGQPDWNSLLGELDRHRAAVRDSFQALLAPTGGPSAKPSQGRRIWAERDDPDDATELLQAGGFDEAQLSARLLHGLATGHHFATASQIARERLDRLMPTLIDRCATTTNPSAVLERLLPIIDAVTNRSTYLTLLYESPVALEHLVRLATLGSWATRQIAQHPALLDELLDPRSLYAPPGRDETAHQIATLTAGLPADDLEGHMNALRDVHYACRFRIACADLMGLARTEDVGTALTDCADLLVETALKIAWRDLAERHGTPGDEKPPLDADALPILVIGYGKLGGYELGYGSDLDLVFLHNLEDPTRATEGPRPIAGEMFMARLVQRCVHVLSTTTTAGKVYEVDLRLRPNGNAGPMAVSLERFDRYQEQEAWTWEHQALVRARPVAGAAELGEQFIAARRRILALPRNLASLRDEIRDMRGRIKDAKGDQGGLKLATGGLTDIEFIAQYQVLAAAGSHPELNATTSTREILRRCGTIGILSTQESEELCRAYDAMLAADRRHSLGLEADEQNLKSLQANVARIWDRLFGTGS